MCLLALGPFAVAKKPDFTPTEGQISDHRGKVFMVARNYIVRTFNLVSIKECQFNPVRFNSMGVWGDFEARVKNLGDHRFEVKGWIIPKGHNNEQIGWSVVVTNWSTRRVGCIAAWTRPSLTKRRSLRGGSTNFGAFLMKRNIPPNWLPITIGVRPCSLRHRFQARRRKVLSGTKRMFRMHERMRGDVLSRDSCFVL
jgi:hypothetical protein